MARAMIEIEMPECCAACPLMYEYQCGPMSREISTDLWVRREKWCPLKEIESADVNSDNSADECNGDACHIHFRHD